MLFNNTSCQFQNTDKSLSRQGATAVTRALLASSCTPAPVTKLTTVTEATSKSASFCSLAITAKPRHPDQFACFGDLADNNLPHGTRRA